MKMATFAFMAIQNFDRLFNEMKLGTEYGSGKKGVKNERV